MMSYVIEQLQHVATIFLGVFVHTVVLEVASVSAGLHIIQVKCRSNQTTNTL